MNCRRRWNTVQIHELVGSNPQQILNDERQARQRSGEAGRISTRPKAQMQPVAKRSNILHIRVGQTDGPSGRLFAT